MAIPSDATAPGSPVAGTTYRDTVVPIGTATGPVPVPDPPPLPAQPAIILSFMLALSALLQGHRATRQSWNNPDVYMVLKDGILMIHRETGDHPFIVHRLDMEGQDWMLL